MQADDEAMQLTLSELGLEDISSHTLILKGPLGAGQRWLATDKTQKNQSQASFRVTSIGQSCAAGSARFSDCAIVEEIDPGTHMRTITTYAKNVGPVEYRYFRIRLNGSSEPLQIVTLSSCKIMP